MKTDKLYWLLIPVIYVLLELLVLYLAYRNGDFKWITKMSYILP